MFALFKKTILLLILGSIIFVFVLEIGLRLAGHHRGYYEKQGKPYSSIFNTEGKTWYHTYQPGQLRTDECPEFSFSYKANNEGFLDTDFSTHKDSNTFRILILGDSFTQGIGVEQHNSFPKQLEKSLNTFFTFNPRIEVYNCGIGNSDPVFQRKLLFDKLLKYHPDMVIDVINGTDINDITIRGGRERFKPNNTLQYNTPAINETLYQYCYIYRCLVHDVWHYNWMFLKPNEEEQAKANSLAFIKLAVYRMDSICYTNHIPFLLLTHPTNFDLNPQAEYAIASINDFCMEERIDNLNLKDYFDEKHFDQATLKALYWPQDGHFKKLGYSLMANYTANAAIQVIIEQEERGNAGLTP